MNTRTKVLDIAQALVGTMWRQGQTCQCANFVRYVFATAGYALPVEPMPSDISLCADQPQGPSYANSLAGPTIGPKIPLSQARAGDIVLFKDTYGSYAGGTITHVGIMSTPSRFIHRPTADRPVEEAELASYWVQHVAEVRRPALYDGPAVPKMAKFYAHDGKGVAYIGGRSSDAVLKIYAHDGKISAYARLLGDPEGAEFSAADVSISTCEGRTHRLHMEGGTYTVELSSGGVSASAPLSLVVSVIDGRATMVHNLGFGTYIAGANFALTAILTR